MEFVCRNVNDAYRDVIPAIMNLGIEESSRNGRVMTIPYPTMITYTTPRERVLLDPIRDANPFFHLMEAIWMLAGEKAAAWPVKFNKQMAEYANDDGEYDGAYGYRWRRHFGFDQIMAVADMLRADPTSRRAVIQMYDPRAEKIGSKDIPCNTAIYFRIINYRLHMTVTNRSNDAVWGAFGANAVHMSILQEVVASLIGPHIEVGTYTQFTNNLHIYVDIPKVRHAIDNPGYIQEYYVPYKLVTVGAENEFLYECEKFLADPEHIIGFKNTFFYDVAQPMYFAWDMYKKGYLDYALSWASQIHDTGWKRACMMWLGRRQK